MNTILNKCLVLPEIFRISKFIIETFDTYLFDSRCKALPKPDRPKFCLKHYLHQECNETLSLEATDFYFNYVDVKNKVSVSL